MEQNQELEDISEIKNGSTGQPSPRSTESQGVNNDTFQALDPSDISEEAGDEAEALRRLDQKFTAAINRIKERMTKANRDISDTLDDLAICCKDLQTRMNQNVNNKSSMDKHLKHVKEESRNTEVAHAERLKHTDQKGF